MMASQPCTFCEWLLRELLNENVNMGVQNNYFVRKRPFSMGWNGGYGFKNSKKIKYRSLREKTTPFLHTKWPGGRLMPYSYRAVRLCLLRPLRMRIWAKFARISRELRAHLAQFSRTDMHIFTITTQVLLAMNPPNVLCSLFALFAASGTLTKGMYIVEVTKGPLAGPPSQLLYGQRALPTHGPLCDVPPLCTEAVVYGVIVNDNLHVAPHALEPTVAAFHGEALKFGEVSPLAGKTVHVVNPQM